MIPLFIDGMDDTAMMAYSAWPERLYVIGTDGRIAYRGDPGPWKLRPGRMEKWLEKNVGKDVKTTRRQDDGHR
jgi:hypothetical protein